MRIDLIIEKRREDLTFVSHLSAELAGLSGLARAGHLPPQPGAE